MADIMKNQDAMEQKKKLSCLLFMGSIIQKHNDFTKVWFQKNDLQYSVGKLCNAVALNC